jgi:hypothetical protein
MSGEGDPVLPELIELTAAMARPGRAPQILDEVCARLVDRFGCRGVGASLVDAGRVHFTTATPVALRGLQALELRLTDPPSAEAVRTGRPVFLNGTAASADGSRRAATASRHTALFAAAAAAAGVVAAAVLPLGVPAPVGAIALYAGDAREWSAVELGWAELVAVVAGGFLRSAAETERCRRAHEELLRASKRRLVVEQAKGAIAARRAIDIEEAFRMLRRYANDHNATLVEVAEAVIKLGLRI